MDVVTRKLAEALAPFLAQYLSLNGGQMNDAAISRVLRITSATTRGLTIMHNDTLFPKDLTDLKKAIQVGPNPNYGLFLWATTEGISYMQGGRADGYDTSYSICLQPFGGKIGIGTPYPKEALHVNGNMLVNGTINGTSTASLVSLDDLRQVLSTDQIAKLEAKVQSRIALAKVSDTQSEMGGGW